MKKKCRNNRVLEDLKKTSFLMFICFSLLIFMSSLSNLISTELWDILTSNNTAPGYLRFDISNDGNFFLVDNQGNIVYQDSSLYGSNISFYKLLKNGYWSTVTIDNKVRIYNDNFSLIGQISISQNLRIDAHDIESLSNGHYLLLCTETRIIDMSQIVEGGQTNAEVNGVVLVEADLNSNIHWQWNSFDYLNITDVTEDIDLTQYIVDFTHANAVAEDLDGNIIVSIRHFDEIIKIEKQTKRIMWRLGGSASRNNEFEFVNDTENGFFGFSHQHAINVLPDGHLLLFDNGNLKPIQFSRAVEYELDTVNKICRLVWDYREAPDIFYGNMGNAQRLANGNTLINWGQGRIMEIRQDHSKAFDMRLESSLPIYRAFRYKIRMDAVLRNINSTGSYNFNEGNDSTGVSLTVTSLTGQGLCSIEKHYYQAKGNFNDTNFSRILPYRWVLSKYGVNTINGRLKINLSNLSNIIDPRKLTIYKRDNEGTGTFIALGTDYNASQNEIYADFSGLGEFVIGSNAFESPYLYRPAKGSKAISSSGTLLEWIKVNGANGYLLQIAKDSNFTNLIKDTLVGKSGYYNLWNLDDYTVYFWRVATVGSKDTSDWSDIFYFRTKIGQTHLVLPNKNQGYISLNCILMWNKLNGANFYNVEVARDSLFNDIIFRNEQFADTTIEVALEEYNRKYYWRVKGFNQEENGTWSDIRNFRSVLAKPVLNLPHNLETNVDVDYEFIWIGGGNFLHYRIIIAYDSLFKNIVIDKENIAEQKYTVKGLQNDSLYYWKIQSTNDFGDTSLWSEVYSFSTKLGTVILLNPEDNSEFKYVDVNFSWGTVSGASEYLLQIAYDSGFFYLFKEETITDSTNYLLKNLNKDINLFWRVQARNNYKFGNWSETRRLVFKENSNKLIAPVLISPENKAKDIEINGFLIWESAEKNLLFDVQLSTDNKFNNLIVNVTDIKNPFFEFDDLQFAKTYYWRVRSKDSVKTSDWSDVWEFHTKDSMINDEVLQLLYPDKGQKAVQVNGILTWNPINLNQYSKYYLEISRAPDFSQIVINRELDTNYFNYIDLKYFTNYFWRVGLDDKNGQRIWSDIWNFETELESPTTMIKNDSLMPVSGKIQWKTVDGATNYSFILSMEPSLNSEGVLDNKLIVVNSIEKNEYEYNLENNQKYYWQVRANGNDTYSRWSEVHYFITEEGTGLTNQDNDNLVVEILPNPFNDEIIIKRLNGHYENINLKIINFLGIEVSQYNLISGNVDYRINCNYLSSGIYYLIINEDSNIKIIKMIKSE